MRFSLLGHTVAVFTCSYAFWAEAHPLYDFAKSKADLGQIHGEQMLEISSFARGYADAFGRVTPDLQDALYKVESDFYPALDDHAKRKYQSLVGELGAKMKFSIEAPEDQTPFWLLNANEFKNFRSTPTLPKKADYVVVGAGLTGTSIAYHLSNEAAAGKSVIVIERDHPAAQSSGRNGGNFQLLPETYIGQKYDGLVRERMESARLYHPDLDEKSLRVLAERHARIMVNFSVENYHRFVGIVEREGLGPQCDFSQGGWLRIPSSSYEEETIISDYEWLGDVTPKIELWAPDKIKTQFQVPALYTGRMALRNGNYHPYKFVVETLKKTMKKGVKLYTGVKVVKVSPMADSKVLVETDNGPIEAAKVIVATNAFVSQIFPDLSVVKTIPSQVVNYEHLSNHLKGATITEERGDHYYNFPLSKAYTDSSGSSRGMLHYGLDVGYFVESPDNIPLDTKHFQNMQAAVNARFPETRNQPPSRSWVGPMAITEDRTPVIGFMYFKDEPTKPYKNIIISAAFQGYGGSYCMEAGYIAVRMALTEEIQPEAPEDLFSPKRFWLQSNE